jgi:hypothetical protein
MAIFSKKDKLKKGRNIFVPVSIEEISCFKTIMNDKAYKVLPLACKCGIDDFNYLSLFKLKRVKYNIKNKYWYNWLYHASFSPIWAKRIHDLGGYPDYNKKIIIFKEEPNDDLMQIFYNLYGYEPDEQSIEVQEKSIIDIKKINNWFIFYKNFRKNGLVEVEQEELKEFDIDGISY